MKSKLDQLEFTLQKIVESSATVLWKNDRLGLVRKLMEAIEKETGDEPSAVVQVPHTLVVQVHPRKYALWQESDEMLEGISEALQEAAVELDLPLKTRPSIFLEADPAIPENDLQLFIVHSDASGSKTAIINAENNGARPGHHQSARSFLILENGDHFPLDRPVTNIGRREQNELMLNDPHISREHAQIRLLRGVHVLFDLNSKGGTFVNGRKIKQYTLQPGDVISLSGRPLIYGREGMPADPADEIGITSTTRMDTTGSQSEEDR